MCSYANCTVMKSIIIMANEMSTDVANAECTNGSKGTLIQQLQHKGNFNSAITALKAHLIQ